MAAIQPPQKIKNKYQNTVPTIMMRPGTFWNTLWKALNKPSDTKPGEVPGPFITDPDTFNQPASGGLRITWFGHSSLMIEVDGLRILTDPVWSKRASFASWIGPKRFFPAPLALKDLPTPDLVLLSHDHYDHLDKSTIQYLMSLKIPFVCSEGVGPLLVSWGVDDSLIREMTWGNEKAVGPNHHITATPARHFSGRSLFNRNETLWSSFIISSPQHRIFFGADSGWFPGFKEIGDLFGPFDLTMLEIGAYNDNWPDIHMGPVNAANAHLALRGKMMLPIHWGTFDLALHPWTEPVEKLLDIAKEKNISLFIPEPGKPTEVNGELNSEWWK